MIIESSAPAPSRFRNHNLSVDRLVIQLFNYLDFLATETTLINRDVHDTFMTL